MFDKHKGKKPNHNRVNEPGLTSSATPASSTAPTMGKSAVIGAGIVINGDITGTENLLIEGKIKGKVSLTSNEVKVGQSGEVIADITARVVSVSGKVHGDIHGAEKVIINSTGNVRGNIVAPRMMLEDGAIFKGSIDMDPGEPAQAKVVPTSRAAVKPSPSAAPGLVIKAEEKSPDLALKSG